MEHPEQTTQTPEVKKVKLVKMTPKQIQKAEEQARKHLLEQEEASKELDRQIEEGLTPLDIIKALKTYKRLLIRNNKAVKKNYDAKKDIVKTSVQKARDAIKEMKETLIKKALDEAKEVYNNTILKSKNNIQKGG